MLAVGGRELVEAGIGDAEMVGNLVVDGVDDLRPSGRDPRRHSRVVRADRRPGHALVEAEQAGCAGRVKLGLRRPLLDRDRDAAKALAEHGWQGIDRLDHPAFEDRVGILFLLVMLAEGGLDFIQQNSNGSSPVHGLLAKALYRQLISLILVTIWFSLLFKFLPDGRPSWKTVIAGAGFTGFLFTVGKVLMQWVLNYSSMQTIYGASAASVLLLLFVFYSSFIFYYGACFTKVWAEFKHQPIQPAKYAEKYKWAHVPA